MRSTMYTQLSGEPRSLMDDKNHLSRERERRIEHMNRRMEEKEREMERRLAAMRRRFEDPALRSESPSRRPEEEGLRGEPGSDFQAQQPEFDPAMSLGPHAMPIDLLDREEEFVLTAAVPGFSKEEIGVNLVEDVLQIEATREESEEQENEGRYVTRERPRSMNRSVALGTSIAEDEEITASYESGVVTVRLPKAEPAKEESARQIDIE